MFYILNSNGVADGPYTLQQLTQMGITPTTMVCVEGMNQWVMAKDMPQLKMLFGASRGIPMQKIAIALGVVVVFVLGIVGGSMILNKKEAPAPTVVVQTPPTAPAAEAAPAVDYDLSNVYSNTDYYRYQWLSKRYLTSDDVAGLSRDEMRIVRNYIFAYHDYAFLSSDLQRYFGKFSEYHASKPDVYHEFNSVEKTNIEFLKRREGR